MLQYAVTQHRTSISEGLASLSPLSLPQTAFIKLVTFTRISGPNCGRVWERGSCPQLPPRRCDAVLYDSRCNNNTISRSSAVRALNIQIGKVAVTSPALENVPSYLSLKLTSTSEQSMFIGRKTTKSTKTFIKQKNLSKQKFSVIAPKTKSVTKASHHSDVKYNT